MTLTQVGRALKQLGIRHIPPYTPEERGRMERVFRTLQQRLAPLPRRADLLTMQHANAYPRDTPEHNEQFGREARNLAARSWRAPASRWTMC
jgi:hypothetical protein